MRALPRKVNLGKRRIRGCDESQIDTLQNGPGEHSQLLSVGVLGKFTFKPMGNSIGVIYSKARQTKLCRLSSI
jgi:hypothetical protein